MGTISLIFKDRLSNYADTILSYALAESLSHDQSVLLLAANQWVVDNLISSVPLNLNFERSNGAVDQGTSQSTSSQEDEKVRKDDDRGDVKLKIAWQYEKYLAKENNCSKPQDRSVDGRLPFCCSYDLSRQLQPLLLQNKLSVFTWSDVNTAATPSELTGILLKQVTSFLQAPTAATISRIFLLSFHEYIVQISMSLPSFECCQLVTRFFVALKRVVRVYRCAVSISISPTIIAPELFTHIVNCMDTVMEIESFAGNMDHIPYEFQEFVGFFIIRKMQRVGMLAAYPAKAARYGLKRDRRKLYIEPLHLPPEESRALASQTAKIVEAETAVNQQAAHNYAHAHQHSHRDEHDKKIKDSLLRQPVQLQFEPQTSAETEKSATSKPESSREDTNYQPPQKSGLAASLAAARAARAAGVKPTSQPVSISGAPPTKSDPSLDF